MNLYDAIFATGRRTEVAVWYEGRQLTYQALQDATDSMGSALRHLSLESGERVAILLNDSPEFIATFLSVASQGAIAVPINMGLRPEAQTDIIKDCTARIAVVEADFCNRLLTGAWETLHQLKDLVIIERNQDDDELVRKMAATQAVLDHGLRIHSLQQLRRDIPSHGFADHSNDSTKQPAFILYTSGSTGEPKGAVHCNADIFYTNQTYASEVLQLRDGDRLFSSSRLPFAYGLGNSFTFPLLNGRTTVLCREKPTPAVIKTIFHEAKPSIFFAVPVVYTSLLDYHQNVGPLDCGSLRLCISAGEALPAAIGEEWERTFGVPVLDGIGSTEMLHMWMSNHEGEIRYGSSGKLLRGYEARLLSAEGNETPANEDGNLWIRGASAAMGYWQRPVESARVFVDGWVRTGDLYRFDSDGFWYHMGRSDDCFKSGGQWVSPVEVESVLLRNVAVVSAAVVEAFDDHQLPCACAFIIKRNSNSSSASIEAELKEQCRAVLPRHKQPRRYIFVEELPYTATGKIQRFKLREMLRGGTPQ